MKIETQELENHQIKLTVETTAEPLDAAKHQAARKLARRTKIPGFRPGKAPYAMILRHLGEQAILDEAIEILVNDIYPKALEEEKVDPYGPGELEKIVSIDPPKFEFLVPLKPRIEIGDYKSVRIPYEPKQIAASDVDEVIDNLRERQAFIEAVDRPAATGDILSLVLSGKRKEVAEGAEAEIVKERQLHVLVKDSEDDLEYPFPGFARSLVGLSKGEARVLEHTFPEDFYVENLRSAEAEYTVRVEEVKSHVLPELDDEFAKSIGEYATLDELRAAIQSELQEQATAEYDDEYGEQVLDEVIKLTNIKYPPQMLEREIDQVIEQLEKRLQQQKLDMSLYLKSRKMTMGDLREEVKPVAESRLEKTLLILELSEAEAIRIDAEEVQEETNRTMDQLSDYMEDRSLPKRLEQEVVNNVVGNVMMDMMIKKTMVRMRDLASGRITAAEQSEESTLSEGSTPVETPPPADSTADTGEKPKKKRKKRNEEP